MSTQIKAGDILKGTWGYDQTVASFYLVIKRTSARVTLRELKTVRTEIGERTMSGTTMPSMKPWDTDFRAEHLAGRHYSGGRNYSENGETAMVFYELAHPHDVVIRRGVMPAPLNDQLLSSESVRIDAGIWVKPWDGKPVPTTWYA